MLWVVVDLIGGQAASSAAKGIEMMHSDRLARLEDAWDARATVRLVPALPPGAAIDPDLTRVSSELFDAPRSQLPLVSAWRPAEDGQPARMVSASHSWAALAFSRAARDEDCPVRLIHIDAHDDLAQPPPGRPVDVRDPAAVLRAVVAGRLGIGSFIAPFVDAGIIRTVEHVRRANFANPLRKNCLDPVWLDIDLDCLCNCLDDHGGEPAIDAGELERRVDSVARYVSFALPVPPRLLTVALSPGFFPAAHWQPALIALQRSLATQWPGLQLPFVSA